MDKIGQNLEIFPVDDTGLRLRKKNVFVILLWNVQKIDEQLLGHWFWK